MSTALQIVLLALNGFGLGQPVVPELPPPSSAVGFPFAPEQHPQLPPPAPPAVWVEPMPPVPAGAWWHGAMVPMVHQRTLYFPSWDYPLRWWKGQPPLGEPAVDIPQGGVPIYWKRIGQ